MKTKKPIPTKAVIQPFVEAEPSTVIVNNTPTLDWKNIIADWENSGLSQTEFCKSRKLNYQTFGYQRSKSLKKMIRKTGLLPVKIIGKDQPIGTNHFILQWPTGMKLSIPINADSDTLKILLSYASK